MASEWVGWHFLQRDCRLGYGDGRGVQVGETLTVPEPLSLCRSGLHASLRPLDALDYAPGPVACRVRLSGTILAPEGEDKACATERTVLAMADATQVIAEWSIWCAERVLHLFERERPGDLRPRRALWAKRRWLKGEIADEEMAAARAAAGDAARAAAWDAAGDAARAAARAAAGDAAWDAARAAARDAAWAAARAAAGDAAWDEQNAELERRLLALLGTGEAADGAGPSTAD